MHACDYRWWKQHNGAPGFAGLKTTLDARAAEAWPEIHLIRHDRKAGYSEEPDCIRTGGNSGYQAVHLAARLGASRILLLGYDMKAREGKKHFFGDHPPGLNVSIPFDRFIAYFESLAVELKKRGVEVINCTPDSALPWFPRAELKSVL